MTIQHPFQLTDEQWSILQSHAAFPETAREDLSSAVDLFARFELSDDSDNTPEQIRDELNALSNLAMKLKLKISEISPYARAALFDYSPFEVLPAKKPPMAQPDPPDPARLMRTPRASAYQALGDVAELAKQVGNLAIWSKHAAQNLSAKPTRTRENLDFFVARVDAILRNHSKNALRLTLSRNRNSIALSEVVLFLARIAVPETTPGSVTNAVAEAVRVRRQISGKGTG